ncbi:TetR/AcrR family transcriptional regulator [Pokkaliibacter sp. CJK22405]|uniref:TetR/AcrR family transcriptional regulator n=1 Tax=Pokkaliibacter sp. CJK22405 TaxID=3384615 RepID=UPI00398498A7
MSDPTLDDDTRPKSNSNNHEGLSEKEKRALLRRTQILDAATDCFVEYGFHRASMAVVAKAAAMSPGHIYHYFESKEDIIAAIIERSLEEFYENTDSIQSADELIAGILEQLENKIACNKSCHPILMLEATAEASRHPELASVVQSVDRKIRERLMALLAGNRELDIEARRALEARVELVCVLFAGLGVRGIRNPDVDREALAEQLKVVITRLFAESCGH